MEIGEDSAVFTDSIASIPLAGASGVSLPTVPPSSNTGSGPPLPERTSSTAALMPIPADASLPCKGKDTASACLFSPTGSSPARSEEEPKPVEEEPEEDDEQLDEKAEDGTEKAVVVPEVVFDEHGQTWDVYGAEFDPEILGQAIQSHLEKIMKRRLSEKTGCVDRRGAEAGALDSPQIYKNEITCRVGDGHDPNDRALGFFLRYLCFLARSHESAPQNS